MWCGDDASNYFITYEMTIILDILNAFMENWIRRKIYSSDLLSQCSGMASEQSTPNVTSNSRIHNISITVSAIALYSASVEERDTTCCFSVFQEIGEPPN